MATFSGSPSASNQDAQQIGSTVTVNGTGLNANNTGDRVGIIIDNVTIAQGATISAATLTLNFSSGTFDDPDVTIYGIDEDSAAVFTTTSNDLSGRTLTTATQDWTATGVGTGTEVTPSLVAIVQEIVDRGGWASGNDMGFMFVADSNSSNFRVNAYDNGSDYAVLDVTYTTSTAHALTGTTAATSGTSGNLTVAHSLTGTAAATSGASGSLTVLRIVTVGPTASNHDAHQTIYNNTVVSSVSIYSISTALYSGLYVNTSNIPQGAPVTGLLRYYTISFDDPDIHWHAQAADTAAVFTTADYNISSRTLTTAYATDSGTDVGTGWRTVDVSAPIQEVIDRSGWTGPIVLVGVRQSNTVSFYSYDNGSNIWDITLSYPPPIDVTGTSSATSGATGSLIVSHTLTGTSAAATSATGTLDVTHPLTGTSAATTSATGTLDVTHPLTGTSAATTSATGTLIVDHTLTGTSAVTTNATGDMIAAWALTGTSAATSGAAGSMDTDGTKELVGTATVTSDATGALDVGYTLTGTSAATSGASGAIGLALPLTGAASATSGATGSMALALSLTGTATAASGASGNLIAAWALTGQTDATTGATGALGLDLPLSGTSAATTNATGNLIAAWALTGSASATSGAAGSLDTAGSDELTGTASATSDATAELTVDLALTGTITATSGANAGLTMAWALTGTAAATSGAVASLHVQMLQTLFMVGAVQSFTARGTVQSTDSNGDVLSYAAAGDITSPAGSGLVYMPGSVGSVRTSGNISS